MSSGNPVLAIGQYSSAGKKSRNDDSYGVYVPEEASLRHKGIAMAIADGMSSSDRGKVASEMCVRAFFEDYYATHDSWTVKKSAALVLKALNSWLVAQNNALTMDGSDLVSTLTGAILKAGTLHVFHIGDSRLCLVRNATFEQLTSDHRSEGRRSKNVLFRAMGSQAQLEIEYQAYPLSNGDVLLFTTDGVHDYLPSTRLAELLARSGSLQDIAQSIAQEAIANGSPDNVTCQVVRVDDPGSRDSDTHYAALRALPFPPPLEPGMIFEGFRIVRELHASKRSQVYQAIDSDTGNVVVIKTPSENFEDEPTYLEGFTREDWVGRIVASPHVLRVLQQRKNRQFLYFATEYFEGQTLRAWMKAHPKPSVGDVQAIVEQIAAGLRAFHRRDIVHQDLKPENVMIDSSGLVKIIDFGSSRAASQSEEVEASEQGWVGTLDYTAPEYHLGQAGTNKSDLYSLGVIAYEMLTGALPYAKGFSGPRQIAKLQYVSAREHREDLPFWVDEALARSVAKEPEQRTSALSELVEDLRRPRDAATANRPKPLIERDPLLFWKVCTVLLVLLNLVQLVLHIR